MKFPWIFNTIAADLVIRKFTYHQLPHYSRYNYDELPLTVSQLFMVPRRIRLRGSFWVYVCIATIGSPVRGVLYHNSTVSVTFVGPTASAKAESCGLGPNIGPYNRFWQIQWIEYCEGIYRPICLSWFYGYLVVLEEFIELCAGTVAIFQPCHFFSGVCLWPLNSIIKIQSVKSETQTNKVSMLKLYYFR